MISCTFEKGNTTHLRHVVTGAIIVKDGKVLLEKRGTFNGKPILEQGKWAIIGGFLDFDENLENGIRREVREETGYEVDNLELLHINDHPDRPNDSNRQNVAMIYIARPVSQVDVKTEEVTELKWFSLDELPPKEDIAFDQYDELVLYKKYLKKKFPIPVVG